MEPPKIPPVQASNLPPINNSVSGTRPTPALASLPPDALVNATVVRTDGTNAILRTPAGEVSVRTEAPLNAGSSVVLKIIVNTLASQIRTPNTPPASPLTTGAVPPSTTPLLPQFQAQIVSVDGRAPILGADGRALPLVTLSQSPQPSTQNSGNAALARPAVEQGATIVNVSSGTVLRAVVTAPGPAAQAYLPPPPQITSTSPFLAHAGIQAYQGLAAAPTPNAGLAPGLSVLKVSDVLSVHVLAVKFAPEAASTNPQGSFTSGFGAQAQNPQQQAANAAKLSPQPNFIGTVIGTERSGETVLTTPLGTLKLMLGGGLLPKGTELTLEVLSLGARAPTSPLVAPTTLEEARALLARGATSLSEIASFLQQNYGAAGKEALHQALPSAQVQQQFASRLLWFMGGVFTGNAAAFLGPEMQRMLEQGGKSDLVGRLQKDFGRLKQSAQDGLGNGWTGMLFPVMDGEKIEHGSMFSRRFSEEDAEGNVEEGTRFVVDMRMSQMGPMQLDGLYRTGNDNKKFDLFVRTNVPLDGEVKKEIHDVFTATSEATGLAGTIQFQVMRTFPVTPLEVELPPSTNDAGNIIA